MAAESRPSGGEVSAGCWPTCLSVHVDRHSTDTRPTDALSTHDPVQVLLIFRNYELTLEAVFVKKGRCYIIVFCYVIGLLKFVCICAVSNVD